MAATAGTLGSAQTDAALEGVLRNHERGRIYPGKIDYKSAYSLAFVKKEHDAGFRSPVIDYSPSSGWRWPHDRLRVAPRARGSAGAPGFRDGVGHGIDKICWDRPNGIARILRFAGGGEKMRACTPETGGRRGLPAGRDRTSSTPSSMPLRRPTCARPGVRRPGAPSLPSGKPNIWTEQSPPRFATLAALQTRAGALGKHLARLAALGADLDEHHLDGLFSPISK